MNDYLSPVEMPKVDFDSPMATVLFQLERFRGDASPVTTPTPWLSQIAALSGSAAPADLPCDGNIDEQFICGLRKLLPGDYGAEYRRIDYVHGLMWDLSRFLGEKCAPQYDFLKMAVAFRRFLWISPFVTENDGVAVLLGMAMLRRLLGCRPPLFEPSKVFDVTAPDDREGLTRRCETLLQNLLGELRRTAKYYSVDCVRDEILAPALKAVVDRRAVTSEEARALAIAVEKPEISAQELECVWQDRFLRSRSIRKMLDAGFFVALKDGGRKYTLNLEPFFTRFVAL